METKTLDRLLRLRDVMDATGLSRSTVYKLMREGSFPAPVHIGPKASRWRESAVRAWMDSLPA